MQKESVSGITLSDRRRFLSIAWKVLTGIALAEVAVAIVAFFRSRGSSLAEKTAAPLLAAGPVNAYAPGSVTAFVNGKFYLCRLEDGGFIALSRQCTHLGCTVPWNDAEKKFICPCHRSSFDIRGDLLSAPALRPLDLHPVTIVNDTVHVNAEKRIRRSAFKTEQVVYPRKTPA